MKTVRLEAFSDGVILWANLHLLFWLSLIPFVTSWLGANQRGSWPTALYGIVLLMAAVAYSLLQHVIVLQHGRASPLALAIGRDWKGKLSLLSYSVGIGVSFIAGWVSDLLYVAVAIMWFVPDRRIEALLGK